MYVPAFEVQEKLGCGNGTFKITLIYTAAYTKQMLVGY
jgi:hypothetical protein